MTKSLPNQEPMEREIEEIRDLITKEFEEEFNGSTNCPFCDTQNFTEDETEHRNGCLLLKMEAYISHQKTLSRAEGYKEAMEEINEPRTCPDCGYKSTEFLHCQNLECGSQWGSRWLLKKSQKPIKWKITSHNPALSRAKLSKSLVEIPFEKKVYTGNRHY